MALINYENERIQCILILDKVNNHSGYSNELINNIKSDKLNKNFIREIVYGVLENRILINHILFSNLKNPNKKLDNQLKEIFYIGIYQLLFMDKIPAYAVVSESLKLAEYFKLDKFKGLIDGVLRNIDRTKIEDYFNEIKNKDKRLQIEYSVSKPFYEILKEDYSFKTIKKILASYNEKQEFIIRINNLKSDLKEVMDILEKEDFDFIKHPDLKNSLIINNPKDIFKLEAFKKGYFTVQDGGSILVGKILNPSKNSKVLDLCAAPGGKTCYLAELMENTGSIVANDLHRDKLEKIVENTKRLNCNNIETVSFDGTVEKIEYFDKFDYILVDAPCSGSGIVSRKPEIKLKRTKEELSNLIETQRKLVVNAYRYLKKDGYLVYSTCSIFTDENENQMNWFLENTNFKIEKINFYNKNLDYIKLMPYELGYNGFFMCKFKKTI